MPFYKLRLIWILIICFLITHHLSAQQKKYEGAVHIQFIYGDAESKAFHTNLYFHDHKIALDSIPLHGDSVYRWVIDPVSEKCYLINCTDHSKCYMITFPEILDIIKGKRREKDKDTSGLGQTHIKINKTAIYKKINGYRCLKYEATLLPDPKRENDMADFYMSDSFSLNLMALKPLYDYFNKNVVFIQQVSGIFRDIPPQFLSSFPLEIAFKDKLIENKTDVAIKFTVLPKENLDTVFDISGLTFKSIAEMEEDEEK
jgi:hypothetical protein